MSGASSAGKWPKVFPPLTPEQQRISDDFMHHWHAVLPAKYGIVDRFNHQYPVQNAPAHFVRTLEIGAGNGEHLKYERLSAQQESDYVAVDLRDNMAAEIRQHFPRVKTVTADCQVRLPFGDGHFDRVLAIHVLEHLPNLPAAIAELHRLIDKERGVLSVVIPCEGSWAYTIARKISAQRVFERRYKQPYKWLIEREHINLPDEIRAELAPWFEEVHSSYFPLHVPVTLFNLCIGLTLKPRKNKLPS